MLIVKILKKTGKMELQLPLSRHTQARTRLPSGAVPPVREWAPKRGSGCGRGLGEGCAPSPENFWNKNDVFWCTLEHGFLYL